VPGGSETLSARQTLFEVCVKNFELLAESLIPKDFKPLSANARTQVNTVKPLESIGKYLRQLWNEEEQKAVGGRRKAVGSRQ
jgi:hypothetical protein